jgi:hypothetical protein
MSGVGMALEAGWDETSRSLRLLRCAEKLL